MYLIFSLPRNVRHDGAPSIHMHFFAALFNMQRQYASILPKKSATEDEDADSDAEAQNHKKRRIGVTVACDRCRGRKIRVSNFSLAHRLLQAKLNCAPTLSPVRGASPCARHVNNNARLV